jgi:DNA-binding NarL/FixJ family response regulator
VRYNGGVTIRVVLAEDHALVRAGLERLLAATGDIDVVGSATNGAEAVTLAVELGPDVVLMDLAMPEMDGREATRRITAEAPAVNVVVLTSFSDRDRILEALDAGAVGYLLKDAEPDELVRGVRAAARGESPLAPKAAHALIRARTATRESELSEREREVLGLLARGQANKRIALELGISEKTVKAHVTSIIQRLVVSDRTQAALWAHRNGLV